MQGLTNPLHLGLAFIGPAVKALIDKEAGTLSTDLPKLTDEGLNALENTIQKRLDVPQSVMALARNANTAIEAVVDPIERNELELLRLRADALLAQVSGA